MFPRGPHQAFKYGMPNHRLPYGLHAGHPQPYQPWATGGGSETSDDYTIYTYTTYMKHRFMSKRNLIALLVFLLTLIAVSVTIVAVVVASESSLWWFCYTRCAVWQTVSFPTHLQVVEHFLVVKLFCQCLWNDCL